MTVQEWLGADNQLGIDIWNKKYRNGEESFDQWLDRVSGGDKDVRELIKQKKFLFGGRILSGRGINDRKLSLSNCYVVSPPEDSIESIFECGSKIARTMSYGGGVGVDISKLRPNGALVNNAAKTTSGATSFMDFFSFITGLICQQGRRGALMISISCEHPDIEEFIQIKNDLDRVTKANISIRMTDSFMKAVRDRQNVILSFKTDLGEIISKEVSAYDIMYQIAKSNWEMGEPGVLFWDRICNWNLLSNNQSFEYQGVNPCAEEPLPAGGSCLLGSLNLAEFVKNGIFDYDDFSKSVHFAVKALNTVLDEGLPKHPLIEQRKSVSDWRQIGLGIFGLGDCLIKMKLKYGNEALPFINKMGSCLISNALEASALLAEKYGMYPKCNKELILNNDFFKYHANENIIELVKKHGLRNSQLLTCAPTGTTATLINSSSGIEALFAKSYNRRTLSLNNKETFYKVYPKSIQDLINNGYTEETLPDYVVTTHEIPYTERLRVQATLNKYIDASISSTCNVSESTTIDDVLKLYMFAWESGCKGVTVWRDNCKRQAILTTGEINKEEEQESPKSESHYTFIKKVSDDCVGKKRTLMTGCGSLHFTAFFDKNTGELLETYCAKGSQGGCALFMNGLSRMMSLAARGNISVDAIVDQLKSAGTCPSYAVRKATKQDTSKGSCCPVAIGYALMDMYNEMQNELKNQSQSNSIIPKVVEKQSKGIKCPECGEFLNMVEGCMSCNSCGFSRCG